MKKNTLVKIVAGVLSAVVLTGGAIAATNSKNIDIFFRNIKIMIDGAEYVPTDANGNVVEPFIYNGTTYLPVRAVANAFGKDVKWDGENATVYLGKEGRMEPDNRLDKVQYIDYKEGHSAHWMKIINGTITDYNNKIYTNGLVLYFYQYSNGNNSISIDYPLNSQYSRLTGKIVLPKSYTSTTGNENNCSTSETTVTLLAEGEREIYKAVGVNNSMPFSFDVNVKGVNKLTVKVVTQNSDSYVALTDLGLYK